MSDQPPRPPDGTKDGSGYWLDGTWYTVANYNARMVRRRLAAGFSHKDAGRDLEKAPPGDVADLPDDELPVNPMWRTHHETGSAEERYSRQMRFDKYLAMQQLLNELAHRKPGEVIGAEDIQRAKEILAGMVRPKTVEARAEERAYELEGLMYAYRVIKGVPSSGAAHRAAVVTLEALKAWERAHQPAAIDPLLGP